MKEINKYTYPAVFTHEDGYEIAVTFPEFPGCATSGKDKDDAMNMAREALRLHILGMIADGDSLPEPTSIGEIRHEENETAVSVDVTVEYECVIRDGTPEEQDRRLKEWCGLRPDQSFSEITFTPEEEEKYKDLFAEVDKW